MHGFNFTMIGRESFQGTEAQKRVPVPDRPEADVGRLQPTYVQGMCATGSRLCPRARQVDLQEIEDAWVAKVPWDNSHHGWRLPTISEYDLKSSWL